MASQTFRLQPISTVTRSPYGRDGKTPQPALAGQPAQNQPTFNITTTGVDSAINTSGANSSLDGGFTTTNLETGSFGDTGETPGLAQAEGAMLEETLSDASDRFDIKTGAIDDQFDNLTSYLPNLEQASQNVLTEQLADADTAKNTLQNASTTKQNEIEAASKLLTPLQQAASTETFNDAVSARSVLDTTNKQRFVNLDNASSELAEAERGVLNETLTDASTAQNTILDSAAQNLELKNDATADIKDASRGVLEERLTDAGTATETMKGAAGDQFSKIEEASQALADAQSEANRLKYRNVTDALRADRLNAMRRGESGTIGSSDRMMLEAEMRAADQFSNLESAADVAQAGRTLQNTQKLGQQETDATNILAKAQANTQVSQAELDEARQILSNVNSTEAERSKANSILAQAQASTQVSQADANEAQRKIGNVQQFESQSLVNAKVQTDAMLMDNQTKALVEEAQRTLQNTAAGAAERAEAERIVADTEYANNVAATKLQTTKEAFNLFQNRENQRLEAASELANAIGATQEETLPAVTLAEQLIQQAIDEGNVEDMNADDKYQAGMEMARELWKNPSLMDTLANQIDSEKIVLGENFTAEQAAMINRISNLSKMEGLIDYMKDKITDEMFDYYESYMGQLGAVWAGLSQLQLIDQDGYFIPENAYAMTQVGMEDSENLDFIVENKDKKDGVENVVDGIVEGIGDKAGDALGDVWDEVTGQNDD
jgi:hypothetical protein